jgi:hypothetical protein
MAGRHVPRRESVDAEDAVMRALPAYDYPPRKPQPVPNLKALRRIMAGLIASAVICFGICMALIVRDGRRPAVRPAVHPHCACGGKCLR